MANKNKWLPLESDFDSTTAVRTFSGRLTEKRYQIIAKHVRVFNNKDLYGTSPNGYAYTCGCEHDCCGCLCSQSMEFTYKTNQVVLTMTLGYNY